LNVAENGNAAFAGERRVFKFAGFFEKDGITPMRLPRADGLIMRAPIDGISTSLFIRLDPSIVDEKTMQRDPTLDMYNPANGYDPKTRTARYSDEFIARYGKAQAARMNRLIDMALQCQADAKAGAGQFKDDGFIIYGSTRARLIYADMSIGHAAGKYLVLPENVVEAAKHDRVPDGGPEGWNATSGATAETCRSFLSFRAVRASFFNPRATRVEDWGVDVDSSNNTVAGNLKHVTVPWIILYGTADDKMPGVEMIYNAAKSKDKKVVLLRGATHHLESVDPKRFLSSEKIRALFESEMAKWIDERFGSSTSQ
jgi:pimeloyl-ACP methyl ester carboxylesterase